MTTEPCPHCKTTVRHGARIGCCSGCKVLFASQSAFDRHHRGEGCIDVSTAADRRGELVFTAKSPKGHPDVTMWALAGSNPWAKP